MLTSSSAPEWGAALQRALDFGLGVLLLLFALPVLVVASVAVRIDSPGPVLFRQTRIGRRGREFEMFKLRSMYVDADPELHRAHVRRLLARDAGGAPWSPPRTDPRVTRVGSLLRVTGLDELPQLINVVRGEMSLVGPRPALPYETTQWEDWHFQRLAVRPGITGLWQVEARRSSDFDTMVQLDLEYIARRSLALDLSILVRTPAALWRELRRR